MRERTALDLILGTARATSDGHRMGQREFARKALDAEQRAACDDALTCRRCGKVEDTTEVRYSLGIYAGKMCDACWKASGYRDEGPEGFDPMDAGESYEPLD